MSSPAMASPSFAAGTAEHDRSQGSHSHQRDGHLLRAGHHLRGIAHPGTMAAASATGAERLHVLCGAGKKTSRFFWYSGVAKCRYSSSRLARVLSS